MALSMHLFSTLTNSKELLQKPQRKPLRLFVCGITVNDVPHIGHARTYLFFDLFVRYLRAQKWRVQYIQNITDVDDKIIARAKSEHQDPLKLATTYTALYLRAMKHLGIISVNRYAPATKFIKPIINQVTRLLERGYAYHIPGSG